MTSLQMSSAKFSDLYPERRGAEESPGVLARATGAGHPRSMKTSCERNCVDNIKQMPMVKHMISALRSSGCEVDLTRNLQCDICAPGSGIEHAGGYDPALNQVSWLLSRYYHYFIHIVYLICRCLFVPITPIPSVLSMVPWSETSYRCSTFVSTNMILTMRNISPALRSERLIWLIVTTWHFYNRNGHHLL